MEQTEQASDAPVVVEIPEAKAKKPRKPRAPKVVDKGKLATVNEVPPLQPQQEALDIGFWAGLLQTQKVMVKQKKEDRYSSCRIT